MEQSRPTLLEVPDDKKAEISHHLEQLDTTRSDAEGYGNKVVVQTQDSRYAALQVKNKPNPWSRSLLMLYPILFVAFMNSAANGFDGNTFGGVSDIADFQARFGTNVAASDGFLAAIYILGRT